MREIKFRGKRVDNGEWVEGHYLTDQQDKGTVDGVIPCVDVSIIRDDCHEDYEVKEETIGQFTGFSIKGNDLYRGHIIRIEESDEERDESFYVVIEWIKEWGMWGTLLVQEYNDYHENGIERLDEPLFWTYTLEDTDSKKHFLCGNVHDNPELLEVIGNIHDKER